MKPVNIGDAFDKRFGVQTSDAMPAQSPKWERGLERRVQLLHAFVVEKFGEQEVLSSDISSEMKRTLGIKLGGYLGASVAKVCETGAFKECFSSTKGEDGIVKLCSVAVPKTHCAGSELLERMSSVSCGKIKQRNDSPVIQTHANIIDLKFGEQQHFFGNFIPSYKRAEGYTTPAVQVSFIEGIGAQFGNLILLDNRYLNGAKKGEFVVGRGDPNGTPVLLDISQRAVTIHRWSDFAESHSTKFQDALQRNNVVVTLDAHRAASREVIIYEEGRLYSGFYLQNLSKRRASYIAQYVKESKSSYESFDKLSTVFTFYGYNGIVTCGREQIRVGEPVKNKWQNMNEFFSDGEFWDDRKITPTANTVQPNLNGGTVPEDSISVAEIDSSDQSQKAHVEVQLDPKEGEEACYHCSSDEQSFLQKLIAAIEASGYVYDARDIVRFHTSVKTGMITLLGGAPGCGKSSLAKLYAAALQGSSDGADFLAIDVSPAWTEPQDLLGYRNLEGKYVSAPSGIVPFLQASNSKDTVRLICFEEMNLARVEHYFADFIQAFSRDERDRLIHGVPSDVQNEDRDLMLAPNVRFVGTNNYDETTQQLSARFYDRCNYIELMNVSTEKPFSGADPVVRKELFDFGVSFETYNRWNNRNRSVMDAAVVTKMMELQPLFESLRLGVSKRVENAIANYISNRPFFAGSGGASASDYQMMAFDEAIVQRVLPRYRPNFEISERSKIGNLLKAFDPMPLSREFFANITNSKELPQQA